MKKSRFLSFSIFFVICTVLCTACVDETTLNALDRKKDLERETLHALDHDYEEVAGVYTTDLRQDTSHFLMDLELSVILIQKDGALVPAPSITGSLQMRNRPDSAMASSAGDTKVYPFVVSNGAYDPNLALLSIRVPSPAGDSSSININCHVQKPDAEVAMQTFFCSWNPSLPGERFKFILIKKS